MGFMEKTKIAIWGTGADGRAFYQKVKALCDVICFFDNVPKCNMIDGLPVVTWETGRKYSNKCDIIVIATSKFCKEIANQLDGYGLIYSKNYCIHGMPWVRDLIPVIVNYRLMRCVCTHSQMMDYLRWLKCYKKVAIVYGNCQTSILQKMLVTSESFSSRYTILAIPSVFDYQTTEDLALLDEDYWSLCDLFITQNVSEDNRYSPYLSTNRLLSKLPDCCTTVVIPNVFFRGYWPQVIRNEHNIEQDKHQSGKWPYGDVCLETIVRGGGTVEGAVDEVLQEKFLSRERVLDNAEKSLMELEKRERTCDVMISDYIRKHYRDQQMFFSENHPCNQLLSVLLKRVFKKLGWQFDVDINKLSGDDTLKGQDVPIYPSVIKALGLKKYERKYYPNRYLWSGCFEIKEFLLKYIDDCIRYGS